MRTRTITILLVVIALIVVALTVIRSTRTAPIMVAGVPLDPGFSASWGSEKFPQSKANQILAETGFRITGASVASQGNQVSADSVSSQSSHVFNVQVGADSYSFTGSSDYQWERITPSEWNERLTLELESNDTNFKFSDIYERSVTTDGSELLIEVSDQVWRETDLMPRERIVHKRESLTLTPVDQRVTSVRLIQDLEAPGLPPLHTVAERIETQLSPTSIRGESTIVITSGPNTTEITAEYERTPTPDSPPYEAFETNPFWVMNAEYSRYDIVANGNPQYTLQGTGITALTNLGHTPAGEDLLNISVDIPLADPSGNLFNFGLNQELRMDSNGNMSVTATNNSTGEVFEFYVDPFHDSLPLPPQAKAVIAVVTFASGLLYNFLVAEPAEPQLAYSSTGRDRCQTEDHYLTFVLAFVVDEQPIQSKNLSYTLPINSNVQVSGPRYGQGPESMSITFKNFGDATQVSIEMTAQDSQLNIGTKQFDVALPGCQ